MNKIYFFFLIFNCFVFAQVPLSKDSLEIFLKIKPKDTLYVLALNEYAFLYVQDGDYEKVYTIISQMDALSHKLNYGTGFYKTVNMKVVVEFSKQNPEKAMTYFFQCNDIIKKYKLEKQYFQNSLNNISIIYDQLGDRENATKYALQLINYQEKNKLHPLKTSPYDQIGDNLKFYKKYDEALAYYNKSLAIETQYKNYSGMAIAENKLANVYEDLKQYKKAIDHLKKGLQYAEKIDYKLLQTDLLTNIGRLYQKEKNFNDAEKYLLRSEKICRELDANKSLKNVCQNLGDLYDEKGDDHAALKYYLEAFEISKNIKDPESSYFINDTLSKFYFKKGDFKKAYLHQQESAKAKDSIFKIETLQNTENLLRKYEANKKQQEIKSLTAQNTIKSLKLINANKQKWYLISGSTLLAIIGGMLFYQSRNRKKTGEKLKILNADLQEANKIKARFFSILNHDLRNPVSNLIHFLHLQKEHPELLDEDTRKKMELKITSGAENLLYSMESILLWGKGQMENFKPQPKKILISSLFEDTERYFSDVQNLDIIFESIGNEEVVTDEDYLKTIIRNLTGNAIKATANIKNPKIIWKAWNENQDYYLSISDNGTGADEEKFRALYDDTYVTGIQSGLGLHLIRDLAKIIHCTIDVHTKPMEGTTFTLKL